MTKKEKIKILKEKLNDENTPGAMFGGCGVKHIPERTTEDTFFGLYVPEISTLFFPISNSNGIWSDYEVMDNVNNLELAKGLTKVHYNS